MSTEQAAVMTVPNFPTTGKTVTIPNLPGPTAKLKVTYQPDAPISETVEVNVAAATDAKGFKQVEWTPKKPGIAKIEAVNSEGILSVSVDRSVTFDGLPLAGVGIFVMAALVLFGGSAWALRLLLSSDD